MKYQNDSRFEQVHTGHSANKDTCKETFKTELQNLLEKHQIDIKEPAKINNLVAQLYSKRVDFTEYKISQSTQTESDEEKLKEIQALIRKQLALSEEVLELQSKLTTHDKSENEIN